MKQQNIIRIDDWQPGAALGCHQDLILCAQISIIRNIDALKVSDDKKFYLNWLFSLYRAYFWEQIFCHVSRTRYLDQRVIHLEKRMAKNSFIMFKPVKQV